MQTVNETLQGFVIDIVPSKKKKKTNNKSTKLTITCSKHLRELLKCLYTLKGFEEF